MATKPSSTGPNPTTSTPAKQARSRKTTTQNADVGRAGSAGGIVLEKEKEAKSKSTPIAKPTPTKDATSEEASTANKTPRRKPRKLNKEPAAPSTPASTTPKASATTVKSVEPPTTTEIEALKSRVRGLEAKVEELYKTGSLERPSGRSPRRRGKGRKGSSQQQVPTLSSTKATVDDNDDVEEIGRGNGDDEQDEEEGVEELVRLEGELEVARQDLAAVRPRDKRSSSNQTYAEEDVEDIPRDAPGVESNNSNRHVTLSGSYRIPLPASVSVDDVKHIQSGVSAAQNVARGFLEQRRAAAAVKPSPSTTTSTSAPQAKKTTKPRPAPKSVSSSIEIAEVNQEGKQSWSDWIGGYSVAISRAVKNIEHEAAVESQRVGAGNTPGPGSAAKKAGAGAKRSAGSGGAKKTGARPGVKTKLSGELVDGLMN
ncbi:hypothetical protein CC86DRAFT_370612 [Ophiobolus disseminans]|uniref:Uncharacterized protein n=1 Tax=Ophiobolus disseminans TaxID=1469910 RepID=A0A6A6ZX94_9PLEO|nr:hypothetical protein CC86DRAFT_370612 [Ophiobolus disseminans]